jgi:hypothetical protein
MEIFEVAERESLEERRAETVKVLFEDKKTTWTKPSVDVRRVELTVQEFPTQFAKASFDLFRRQSGKRFPSTHCGDLGGENRESDT